MQTETRKTAFRRFCENFRELPGQVRETLLGPQYRPVSDRERSLSVFNNFFLHIHSVKTHRHSLKWSYTLGLGLMTAGSFLVALVSGLLLMIYYKPSIDLAYQSTKDIDLVVNTGRFIRNIHRWSAHLMVIGVFAHMTRVFYTASYRRQRSFNWLLGLGLLIVTLGLSFTGYLLPWDQLAYWALTICANIASSPREVTDALRITPWFDVGGFQKVLLLGSTTVGEDSLIRFYLLHVAILPLALVLLLAVHIWRIRKDGGLSRPGAEREIGEEGVSLADLTPEPDGAPVGAARISGNGGSPPAGSEPLWQPAPSKTYGLMALVRGRRPNVGRPIEETVPTWPHVLYFEAAALMVVVAITLLLSLFFNAPLKEMANPAVPENPAKAPWYFLGLQELVAFSAFAGGILIPTIALVGLALIPFLDREGGDVGVWFSGPRGRRVFWQSLAFGTLFVVAVEAFCIRFGWLRDWFPDLPQIVITVFNPGTLIVGAYVAWSLHVMRRTDSTRMAAIALYTCFLVGFVLLTIVGTYLRGPNWGFYWSRSQWPLH